LASPKIGDTQLSPLSVWIFWSHCIPWFSWKHEFTDTVSNI